MSLRQTISNLGDKYTSYRQRSGRGGVYLSEIDGIKNAFTQGGVFISTIFLYTHFLLPWWCIPLIWFGQKLAEYGMGLLDQKVLHWWHKENNFKYLTDPFMQELMERIKNIEDKLK